MKTKKLFLKAVCVITLLQLSNLGYSQNIGINSTGSLPNAAALLDVDAAPGNNKGILIPRIALTQTTSNAPVGGGVVTSLLVYNTATLNDVTPGYYYWDGTKWMRMLGANNAWLLTGNAGTTVGTNFLGTTDNIDLQFNVFNKRSGLIDIANGITVFGYQAGLNTPATGIDNSFFGAYAGLNTTGIINSFFGYGSGQTNLTGQSNTAMGYYSLLLNSSGSYNTALGVQTLYKTTGNNNTGVGTNAGYAITSGNNNTAVGYYAMNAGLVNLTTGNSNTAVGYQSSELLTSGAFNTSMGYSSLLNNLTGVSNTGIGGDALFYNGSSYNTAVGMWSLEGSAIVANNTGVANTAIGFCAGGGYTGVLGSGTNNYLQITSGSYNTFLGYSTAMSAGTFSNTTTVGAFAEAGANDVIILGGIAGNNGCITNPKVGVGCNTPQYALHVIGDIASSATVRGVNAYVTGAITACSDVRYKKNITPLTNSLDNVLALRGVNYVWKTKEFPEKKFSDEKQIGFIAQEIEKIFPELVLTGEDGYKSVDYSRLTPILVEAIKEQQKKIDSQQTVINNLQTENKNMNAQIAGHENRLKALEEILSASAKK